MGFKKKFGQQQYSKTSPVNKEKDEAVGVAFSHKPESPKKASRKLRGRGMR